MVADLLAVKVEVFGVGELVTQPGSLLARDQMDGFRLGLFGNQAGQATPM
jgi:hypothetical protein